MSLTATLLIAPLIDILTGKVIEAGTGGDAAKIVARAKELIAINAALAEINSGNGLGLAELQAALTTTALAPGESLALQSLFGSVANQISLLTNIAGSTLVGQGATLVLDNVLATATAAAQAYVAKYSPAPAAAAA